jgi:hypothetical protein
MSEDQKKIDITVSAGRLQALIQVPEWSEMEKLLDSIYQAELGKLKEKENPEARGFVKCIDLIWSKVFDTIRYGKKLSTAISDEYKQKLKGELS